jgi:hypothetical protein
VGRRWRQAKGYAHVGRPGNGGFSRKSGSKDARNSRWKWRCFMQSLGGVNAELTLRLHCSRLIGGKCTVPYVPANDESVWPAVWDDFRPWLVRA